MNLNIKVTRGTTAQNDALLLPEGRLSIDLEKKALRFHDGVTVGGFEVLGFRAVTANATRLAGDDTLAWYGEVSQEDFTTVNLIRTSVGLDDGVPINGETPWLKFMVDGNYVYTPKLPIMSDVSYNQLEQADLSTGNTLATIDGRQYKLRLLRGSVNNPVGASDGSGSEWNRLFGALQNGQFASMTAVELGLDKLAWTRETDGGTNGLVRSGVDGFELMDKDTDIMVCWRPVLEQLN
jgi:hypothetical protein